MPARSTLATFLVLIVALGACSGGNDGATRQNTEPAPRPRAGPPPWPAPPNPLELARRAGLEPEPSETLTYHVHAHLDVFVDGEFVPVPAGIGINIDDPGVGRFTNPVGYGGIELCQRPCISPLHTHDETGVLHTESPTPEPNTLGQFFTEWNVRFDDSCIGGYCKPNTSVRVYVDGEPSQGDPRAIELTDHKEIAIVIGKPPDEIPRTFDFSGV